MTIAAQKLQDAALVAVQNHFSIPHSLWRTSGRGIPRILVSAALASPAVRPAVMAFADAHPGLVDEFKTAPEFAHFMIGATLAYRPVLVEKDFLKTWRDSGFAAALATEQINPLFQKYIDLILLILVAYCLKHSLSCRQPGTAAPPDFDRHVQHLRTLLNYLYATR